MALESRPQKRHVEATVYRHSSPPPKQVRFPSRRKISRSYGKPRSRRQSAALRQQTLTQIDFVSSLSEDPVRLSGSDSEPDASPLLRTARRRTRAAVEGNKRRASPVDDDDVHPHKRGKESTPSCTATSKLHTQTLTQFLGRDIKTAEDGDDDFSHWLGEPSSPDLRDCGSSHRAGHCLDSVADEELVIPQTPVKTRSDQEANPSDDVSTASTVRFRGGGGPDGQLGRASRDEISSRRDRQGSPYTRMVQDSFVTESWKSEKPARESQKNLSRPFTTAEAKSVASQIVTGKPSPSDKGRSRVGSHQASVVASASQANLREGPFTSPHEIPDSEDEEDGDCDNDGNRDARDPYGIGAETQYALEELAFVEHSPDEVSSEDATASTLSASIRVPVDTSPSDGRTESTPTAKDEPPPTRPLRRPRTATGPTVTGPSAPSQPAESQRVAIKVLQSLPPASARSDIILPIAPKALDPILSGHNVDLRLRHKIPSQVVRFWLFDGSLVRYMACVQSSKACRSDWTYAVDQVYELNNPVAGEDMREEGWIERGPIKRYVYLPPAVVGQLLWNLRHAIFDDQDRGSWSGISQRASRPARVVLESNAADNSRAPAMPSSPMRPVAVTASSQATTQSMLPAFDPADAQLSSPQPPQLPPPSSSLVFQDHGGSVLVPPHHVHFNLSQLLTKSQMLPDSLVRDGPRLPLEILDSDDDLDV